MRNQWLAMPLVLTLSFGAVGGTVLFTQTGAAQVVAVDGGWHYDGGYWNYWDAGDRAWYYTDGRRWYTYGDDAWSMYSFDKKFGKAYVREGYVVPKAGPDVVMPKHKVKIKVK